MDNDLALALQLQEELDKESLVEVIPSTSHSQNSSDLSPVDPSWETLDPTPDIRALFLQFNERFFWGRLAGIEIKWSPRMTLCAGLCVYEGHGGLCSVRLSSPLLKLRPRKDLVETLLHEMIHAYLFVTDNNKDHDGHGPEFHKHMYRINAEIGSNISVYHTFHDEVNEYRQHWWRCNGPCQNRKPFYGYVKRAMNRAPSERDPWWKDHKNSCNGTFMKIKEPENYGKNKKKGKSETEDAKPKDEVKNNLDIRSFLGKGQALGSSNSSETKTKKVEIKKTGSTKTGSDTKPSASGSSDKNLSGNATKNKDSKSTSHVINSKSGSKGGNSLENVVILDSDEELESNIFSQLKKKFEKVTSDLDASFPKNNQTESLGGVQAKLREVWANRFSSSLKSKGLASLSKPRSLDQPKKRTSDSANSNTIQKSLQSSSSSSVKTLKCVDMHSQNNSLISLNLGADSSKVNEERKHKLRETHPQSSSEVSGVKRLKLQSEIESLPIPDMFRHSASNTTEKHTASNTSENCHPCPVCNKSVEASLINEHLDRCLADQT